MGWLSMVGAAGSSYIYYWVAAAITAVAFYVGVINIDNAMLTNMMRSYVEQAEVYDRELLDSVNAEEIRHRFVLRITNVMSESHARAQLSQDSRVIREHFRTTNSKFNMVVKDIAKGSEHD